MKIPAIRLLKNCFCIHEYSAAKYDPITPIEETLRVLNDLVKAGIFRYIGTSNFMAWNFMKVLGYSTYNDVEKFTRLQANYSLDNRTLERELILMLKQRLI